MTRINCCRSFRDGPYKALTAHWGVLLADAYDMDISAGVRYVRSADKEHHQAVCLFLSTLDWKITPYVLPGNEMWSQGYELDETCDAYIQWRLSQKD